jgi:hypothetical protein
MLCKIKRQHMHVLQCDLKFHSDDTSTTLSACVITNFAFSKDSFMKLGFKWGENFVLDVVYINETISSS